MPGVLADLERAAASADHGGVFGVPSGLSDLDRNTGGWQPGELIILAARPGVGKTALALGFALGAGVPVGFVSLEMSSVKLATRLCAQIGRVGPARFRSGNATPREWVDWQHAMAECTKREIWIDDEGGQAVSAVRARATRLQRQHRIELLIVDYLQLLTAHGDRREEQVAAIARGLKALAKRLEIPVICCAQLNRQAAPQQGAKKRPRPGLHHLRESGAIEQDADIVMLLDRDTDATIGEAGQACDLIVAKHRNGETGTVPLHWFPATTRFEPGTRIPEPKGCDTYQPDDRKDAGF
jgi:replicative DNA helicase